MLKIQRTALMLTLLILMVGCNRPQSTPPDADNTPIIDPQVTDTIEQDPVTPEPALDTPEIEVTETAGIPAQDDNGPPPPTPDMTQILAGTPISIYPAGTKITLREISMVDQKQGWGIGGVDPDLYHILKTSDGGKTWQDVTPPQPGVEDQLGFTYVEFGIWNESTAWVAYSGADYIWSTQDGGITWQASPVIFMTTVDGMFEVLDEDHVWFLQFLEGGMQKVFTAANRSTDGGSSWELLLDPYNDATIQSFTKTGLDFISPQYGWLTRDFRGVDPFVRLNISQDGGFTWESWELPPPPSLPDLFQGGLADLFDPYLFAPGKGYFRLFSRHMENDQIVDQEFLYKTNDSGQSWEILEIPGGDLYYIDENTIYSVSRDIHLSEDGGETWQKVKSVNWDGKFSFLDKNNAYGIAYDPDDNEYALIRTTDGCSSIEIISPQVVTSQTQR
jgi:photosystem II stability/assembly factor-like uncharacterized protein